MSKNDISAIWNPEICTKFKFSPLKIGQSLNFDIFEKDCLDLSHCIQASFYLKQHLCISENYSVLILLVKSVKLQNDKKES